MEPKIDEAKNTNYLYIEAAKGARIYELILDNKNFDSIENSQIEDKKLNDMDFNKFFKFIEELNAKDDATQNKINEFTNLVKSSIKIIIDNTFPESSPIEITQNLLKLSAFYYLFKLQTASDITNENLYVDKIDEIIDKLLQDKTYYYNILMLVDYVNDMNDIKTQNKKDKFDAYWKIILFLDEKMFFNLLGQYMNKKKLENPQYTIPLPIFSFTCQDIGKKMKELQNILIVLGKTETFKTNERFEYFYAFRYKYEFLAQINYVLLKQGKKPLICLDKITDDITEEAIQFSFYTLDKTTQIKDDLTSELNQLVEVGKKKQNEILLKYNDLLGKYNEMSSEYNAISKEYKAKSKEYTECKNNFENILQENSKYIDSLEIRIKEIRNKYTQQNKIINEQKEKIQSLNKNTKEKEEIIERISYREIGSRIIKFFSLSQSEEKLMEYKQKEISPTNINKIINNIKENLTNYNKYLKENHIDLKYVLNEIKKEKRGYDSLVHDTIKYKEKYLEIMNKNDKQLGKKIDFIISKSKLMNRYVFEKDKNISEKDIYQEFLDIDKELKIKFEGVKEEEEAKNNIEGF